MEKIEIEANWSDEIIEQIRKYENEDKKACKKLPFRVRVKRFLLTQMLDNLTCGL